MVSENNLFDLCNYLINIVHKLLFNFRTYFVEFVMEPIYGMTPFSFQFWTMM